MLRESPGGASRLRRPLRRGGGPPPSGRQPSCRPAVVRLARRGAVRLSPPHLDDVAERGTGSTGGTYLPSGQEMERAHGRRAARAGRPPVAGPPLARGRDVLVVREVPLPPRRGGLPPVRRAGGRPRDAPGAPRTTLPLGSSGDGGGARSSASAPLRAGEAGCGTIREACRPPRPAPHRHELVPGLHPDCASPKPGLEFPCEFIHKLPAPEVTR